MLILAAGITDFSIPVTGLIFAGIMVYWASRGAKTNVQTDAYSAVTGQLNATIAQLNLQTSQLNQLRLENEGQARDMIRMNEAVQACRDEGLNKDRELARLWRKLEEQSEEIERLRNRYEPRQHGN